MKNQSIYFTTSKEVNVNSCLQEFSGTKSALWKYHMDDSNKSRYDMILGRYILMALGLDIIYFYKNIKVGSEVSYEGYTAPIFDLRK